MTLTLREQVLKESELNRDYYTKKEVRAIINELIGDILDPIRSRENQIENSLKKPSLSDEQKGKGRNILTMLKSTENMINDVLSDFLRKTNLN